MTVDVQNSSVRCPDAKYFADGQPRDLIGVWVPIVHGADKILRAHESTEKQFVEVCRKDLHTSGSEGVFRYDPRDPLFTLEDSNNLMHGRQFHAPCNKASLVQPIAEVGLEAGLRIAGFPAEFLKLGQVNRDAGQLDFQFRAKEKRRTSNPLARRRGDQNTFRNVDVGDVAVVQTACWDRLE